MLYSYSTIEQACNAVVTSTTAVHKDYYIVTSTTAVYKDYYIVTSTTAVHKDYYIVTLPLQCTRTTT